MNEGGNYNGGVLFDAFSVRVERTEEGSHAPTNTYVGMSVGRSGPPNATQPTIFHEGKTRRCFFFLGSRCVKYGWHNIVRRKQRCVGAEAWLRLIIREAISIDSLKKLRPAAPLRSLRQLSIVRRISVWDPYEARFRK